LAKPNVSRERILKLLQSQQEDHKEIEKAKQMLKQMVKEDQQEVENPSKGRLATLLFRLRDQTCVRDPKHTYIEEGCDLFADKNSPAVELVEVGLEAVPALIERIDDERYTRAVIIPQYGPFQPYVLRIGDCALAIIERIAARWFYQETYLSIHRKGDPQQMKKLVAAWWSEFQKKGERQMLIEGTMKGDFNSVYQARALIEKYPKNAISSIRQGIKNSEHSYLRRELFQAATGKFVARKAKELPPEVWAFCREFLHDDFKAGPYLQGTLRVDAREVLSLYGDPTATKLLLADWEHLLDHYHRGKYITGEDKGNSSYLITALLRSSQGAGIPALANGWKSHPDFVRMSIIETLRSYVAEPGYLDVEPMVDPIV
jgi:hypothetical protein